MKQLNNFISEKLKITANTKIDNSYSWLDTEAIQLIKKFEKNRNYKMTDEEEKLWESKLAGHFIDSTTVAWYAPGRVIMFKDHAAYWKGERKKFSGYDPFSKNNNIEHLLEIGEKTTYGIFVDYHSNMNFDPSQMFIVDVENKEIIIPNRDFIRYFKLNENSKDYKIIIDKDRINPNEAYLIAFWTDISDNLNM